MDEAIDKQTATMSFEPADRVSMKIKAARAYKKDILKRLLESLVKLQLIIESLILPQVASQPEFH